MTKIFYLFLSFYLAQSDSFIEKTTADFNSNSNFLVLDIKAKNYNGLAIIENDDLFTFYQITQNKNKQEYKLLAQEILTKKNHIEIKEDSIEKWGFVKVKESNRIKAMCENLKAMGANIEETPDGMIIHGGSALHGSSNLKSFNDHRIAMSMTIAALNATSPSEIDSVDCANISFPNFFNLLDLI